MLKQKLQPVLRDCVHRVLQPLLVDPEYQVRIAVVENLEELTKLCLFFGPMRTCDVILSHTITFFNEQCTVLYCTFHYTTVLLIPYFT